jgi:hypothetical protein
MISGSLASMTGLNGINDIAAKPHAFDANSINVLGAEGKTKSPPPPEEVPQLASDASSDADAGR